MLVNEFRIKDWSQQEGKVVASFPKNTPFQVAELGVKQILNRHFLVLFTTIGEFICSSENKNFILSLGDSLKDKTLVVDKQGKLQFC